MEVLGIATVPAWLLTIILIFITLLIYTFYKQSIFRKLGVPGPTPVPFLGILPAAISKGVMQNDYELVRKYGQVFGIHFGNIPELMVSDLEMIKQICVKQFSKFTDRPRDFPAEKYFDDSVFQATGDRWKYLRSTLSPTFSSGKMRNMTSLIVRCTDSLLDVLIEKSKGGEGVDIQPVYQAFTMDVICSTAFGIDVNAQKNPDDIFVKNAKQVFNISATGSPSFLITMLFPFVRPLVESFGVLNQKSMQFFQDASKDVIAERRRSNTKFHDLVQLMVNAHTDQDKETVHEIEEQATADHNHTKRGLTDKEMLSNSLIFMLAGYDTTAVTLTMATHNLTAYPECQEKLIQEIDSVLAKEKPTYDTINKLPYLDMVVDETLRLYTPGFRLNRKALEDVEICGQFIPKGMDVTIPVYAIHRDERYWPDPEKFDPERFAPENKSKLNLGAYMPFGYGPRMCIGMRLALLETKMALVTLLQNFRLKPAPAFKIPPQLKLGRPSPAEGSVTVYLEPRCDQHSQEE